MKSYFQAVAFFASFWCLSVASLVFPTIPFDLDLFDIVSVAGSTGHDYVSITFETPCQDCPADVPRALELTLHVQATQSECLAEAIFVNGAPLIVKPGESVSSGFIKFPHPRLENSERTEVEADVRFSCLDHQASLLSLNINRVGGQDVSSGFTTSFSQTNQPQILRLKSAPHPHLQDDWYQDAWLRPESGKKLTIESEAEPQDSNAGTPSALHDAILELDVLEHQLQQLHKQIKEQKDEIMSILREDFAQCTSVTCYFKTAVQKIPVFAHIIAEHFRHHSHIDVDFFRKDAHVNCSRSHDQLHSQPVVDHDEADSDHLIPTVDDEDVIVESPPSVDEANQPEKPTVSSEPPHGPPFWRGGRPPWAKGDRPPWAKPGSRPPWGRPPWAKPGGRPPWIQDSPVSTPQSTPGPSSIEMQTGLTSTQIMRYHLIGAVIGLVLVLLVSVCIAACIKHKVRIFRDPRWWAEMRARREECETKRAYRKAAFKYRFRSYWKRVLGIVAIGSEEEKQHVTAPKDEAVVNREIDNLRAAYQIVGDMMRAEEGESQFVSPTGVTRPRSESLPSYRSAPPGYSSGQEGDISVVDGFTIYTSSSTDGTSESSVVDCSPRMSFETQRTS